jgi:hypothetical protein
MSAINTSGLNTQYPVAGVNQSSQGFRDNFNNIKQNLDTASNEITDLQNKAILKSALVGANIDNNMNGTIIRNAQTQGFRGTGVNLGTNVSGAITVDTNAADVYFGTITGDITLEFSKWAPAGTLSQVRLVVTSSGVGNITLPAEVDFSRSFIPGIGGSGNTIIAPQSNTYPTLDLLFSTEDCGTTIQVKTMNKGSVTQQVQSLAVNPLGQVGDVPGSIAFDTASGQLFVANGPYNGNTNIWNSVGDGNGGSSLTQLVNGNSNVVVATNSNVTIGVAGNANIFRVTGTGVNVAGTLTATGNIQGSNVTALADIRGFGNITISGTANISGAVTIANTSLTTGSGNITGGNLFITGTGVANVGGNVNVGANLNVANRAFVVGTISGGNLVSNGFANITSNLLANAITSNTSVTANSFVTNLAGNLILRNSLGNGITFIANTTSGLANYTLTFPANDGSLGQVLTTDGSGVLSWTTASGGSGSGFTTLQVFTSSVGSWVVPVGVTKIKVTVVGAGGGGGNSTQGGTLTPVLGGGGGAGAVAIAVLTVTAGTSYSITVGAGGAGGTPSAAPVAGGQSAFGALVTCTGGSVGTNNQNGGTGGTSTQGDINIAGGRGGTGGTTVSGVAGSGASTMFGSGGAGGIAAATGTDGTIGTGYGSGGGAAGFTTGSSSSRTAGAGAGGLVFIEY